SLKSLTYGVQFRTGEGHPRVCWFILPSPRTLSRSATIISIHVGRTPNKKELALHIQYFLALNAKSYNDTA
ncbi:hypothetical protein, partial [Acinetobacter baumannii]|uniref:hypothetical protein n=1 Tax=Acinetobacter baumannii TaxID=470 RepID=UPI001BB46867